MKYILLVALLCLLLGYLLQAKEVVSKELPDIKIYSIEKVLEKWGGGQWTYLNELIIRESNWKSTAQNPKSSAFGYGQFLNSTWKSVGCEKTSDPYIQIDCMIDYVELRYGTPQQAIKFHDKHNWY